MPPQNPADRREREQRRDPAHLHFASNGRSTKLPQGAVVLETTADRQNVLLAGCSRTLRSPRSRATIAPIDTLQPSAPSSPKPTLYGAKRNAVTNRHRTLRCSAPHRSHDLPSPLGGDFFEPLQGTPRVSRLVSQQRASTASPPLGSASGMAGGVTPVGRCPTGVTPPAIPSFYSTSDLNVLTLHQYGVRTANWRRVVRLLGGLHRLGGGYRIRSPSSMPCAP